MQCSLVRNFTEPSRIFLASGVTSSASNLPVANSGTNSGLLSYSPASILATNSKQKSAFAPVRAGSDMGFGSSTSGFGMSGLQAGWAHTFYNVGQCRNAVSVFCWQYICIVTGLTGTKVHSTNYH